MCWVFALLFPEANLQQSLRYAIDLVEYFLPYFYRRIFFSVTPLSCGHQNNESKHATSNLSSCPLGRLLNHAHTLYMGTDWLAKRDIPLCASRENSTFIFAPFNCIVSDNKIFCPVPAPC